MTKYFLVPISTSKGFSDDGELIYSFTSSSDRGLRLMLREFFIENPDVEIYEIRESWQNSEMKGNIYGNDGRVL